MKTVYMHEHCYTYHPKRQIKSFWANERCSYYQAQEWCNKEKRRKLTEPDNFFKNMREAYLMQTTYRKEICHYGSGMTDYPEKSWANDLEIIKTYPFNKINEIENLSKFPAKVKPGAPTLDFYRIHRIHKYQDFVTPMTTYEGTICWPAILRQRKVLNVN